MRPALFLAVRERPGVASPHAPQSLVRWHADDRVRTDVGPGPRPAAINLGQGFPDGPEPVELVEAAARALWNRDNQYPPSRGLPERRSAGADFYSRFDGLTSTADNVVITSGATEAIAATGWKVGFILGSGALLEAAAKAHEYVAFSTPPHLQAAVAEGLAWPEERFVVQATGLARSRDRLAAALKGKGFVVLPSEATHFLCLDLKALGVSAGVDAVAFADRAVTQHGAAGIRVSAFMTSLAGDDVLRLCFAKPDAVLDEAARRLRKARRGWARG